MTPLQARIQTSEVASEPRLTCLKCGTPTSHDALATYGAQCYPCYEAYKREPLPPQKLYVKPARPGDAP